MPSGVITWFSDVEFLSKWSVLWKHSISAECLRWRPPNIYFGREDWQCLSSLEEGGNTTGRWYKSNYLSGNPSKYQVLVMSRTKQEVKKAVNIDGHIVGQAQEITLLGVILDVNLQFSERIKQICTKTCRRIHVLSRLRNLIPTTAKLTIY